MQTNVMSFLHGTPNLVCHYVVSSKENIISLYDWHINRTFYVSLQYVFNQTI